MNLDKANDNDDDLCVRSNILHYMASQMTLGS